MSALTDKIQELLKHEAAGGVLLIMAAIAALLLNNSPAAGIYGWLLEVPVEIKIGALKVAKPLLLWINDGLMAVFFLLVGLEIKRELLEGNLSSWRQAVLPALAALGGMLAPALIYYLFNVGSPDTLRGWAIPAATDIAFAVGVLALLGSRVPAGLKIFLLAVAVIDDLGAIIIIALFFTAELSLTSLAIGGIGAVVLMVLNLANVTRLLPYIVVGLVIWVAVLKSGVHATLAGVLIAFFIPLRTKEKMETPPLIQAEHALHGFVSLIVMPIFAFANAGVNLGGISINLVFSEVTLGIAVGLLVGKQIGILGFTWLGVRLGLSGLPTGVTWLHVYGASALAGIGFTMSLFIGTLAFDSTELQTLVRIGVLSGSLISGTIGYIVLRWMTRPIETTAEQSA